MNEFVFSGILANQAKRELEVSGVLRTPVMGAEETRNHDLFAAVTADVRGASIHMQRCYRVLFVFENLIRDFVATRFQDLDGDTWFDKRASAAMKKKLAERKVTEEKNLWHTGRNPAPIYYLDFGDLSLLIVNHWNEFSDLLPSQAWVQSRMQEAERSRNVIAHTNLLATEEVDRLGMYLRDWIKQVG